MRPVVYVAMQVVYLVPMIATCFPPLLYYPV
jgi:hypothetical protein